MEFFKQKTQINFLGIRRWTYALSLVLIIASFASIAIRGINWGLDFTGGYAIQISYQAMPNLNQVRYDLKRVGIEHVDVVTFGSPRDLRITLAPEHGSQEVVASDNNTTQEQLAKTVQTALGSQAQITQVSYTGPQVGAELAQSGLLAMVVLLIAIIVYIAMRFEMRFAISSAIALAHDPIIIMGIFSFFQLRFDLTALAAVLAVIGYSLNDTVVVYDRVRENFRKMRRSTVAEVVNRAINDTLSRTIITSGLTLIVVVVLFFLGGPTMRDFSLALIIGVAIGTYSSIYVAGALAVALGLDRQALLPRVKVTSDEPL